MSSTQDNPSPTGLLIIDKPLGKTSMHVCANVRARLRSAGAPKRIKVGHAGTLDPLATGVLVVLVGKATRLQDRFMAGRKRYTARVDLSATSRTDDREGPVAPADCQPATRAAIEAVLPQFVGTIMQRPPAYSAMKIAGRRAYDLARKSETEADLPVLEPRPITIDAINILEYTWPILTLDIACAKGTYIRSLARDIGEQLNTGGMLDGLIRTQVGRYTIDHARTLNDLPGQLTQQDLLPIPDDIVNQSSSDSPADAPEA
ncbi:MAG TPA: tRNA pseudouridine(55) synthase TruB [Microbacterium sp.]|nr:tRNA pseudouridine(55) synthase TruB [Microbacterium sp.]